MMVAMALLFRKISQKLQQGRRTLGISEEERDARASRQRDRLDREVLDVPDLDACSNRRA